MHRIGRTARAGRQGQSLLFLTESESPYIAYLKQKTVEFESDSVVPSVTSVTSDIDADEKLRSIMQEEMLVDKDLIDKS